MKVHHLGLIFAALLSWSGSGMAQDEIVKLKKEVLEKAKSFESKMDRPTKEVKSSAVSNHTISARVLGEFRHDETINVFKLDSPDNQFLVQSPSGDKLFNGLFSADSTGSVINLVRDIEIDKCIHRVKITFTTNEQAARDANGNLIASAPDFPADLIGLHVSHVHEGSEQDPDCPPGPHLGHAHGGGTGGGSEN